MLRNLSGRIFAFLLFSLMSSCGNQGPQRLSSECNPKLYESCSLYVENGGSAVWDLPQHLDTDNEYVLSILSLDDLKNPDDLSPTDFKILSSLSSDPISAEEQKLRNELRGIKPKTSNPSISSGNVQLPNGFRFKTVDESHPEFYIPDLRHYEGKKEDGSTDPRYFYVRDNTDYNKAGRRYEIQPAVLEGSGYRVYDAANLQQQNQTGFYSTQSLGERLAPLKDCYDNKLNRAFNILGKPIPVDGYDGLRILLARIQSSAGISLGAFNFLDRFETLKGEAILDSNFSEILYIKPDASTFDQCSTTIHEYQHLINFDQKILKNIPEKDRSDLDSIRKYKLRREQYGLDEGYSHTFEYLFTADPISLDQVKNFLENPSLATRALDYPSNKYQEVSISRGFNTLIIFYALAKAGGQLHQSDAVSTKVLSDLIHSRFTGLQNVANYFDEEPDQFMTEFITGLSVSLFDPDQQSKFLPAPKEVDDKYFGLQISDETDSQSKISEIQFNPLRTNLPLLSRASSFVLPPQGLNLYRLIAPKDGIAARERTRKIEVQNKSTPFLFIWTRVR